MTRLRLKSLIKITQVLCPPLNCKNGNWLIISSSGHLLPQTKQLLPSAAKFERKNGAAVMRKPLRGVMKLHQDFSFCLKDPHFSALKVWQYWGTFFFPPLPSFSNAKVLHETKSQTCLVINTCEPSYTSSKHSRLESHLVLRLAHLPCTSDNHPLSYTRAPSLLLAHPTCLVHTHVFLQTLSYTDTTSHS